MNTLGVYQYFKRKDLNRAIWRRIKVTDVVLDVGCGIRPQTFFKPSAIHICVEPCPEYFNILKQKYNYNGNIWLMNKTAQEIMPIFSGVDTVFLLDVLEHLPKHEGAAILTWACGIARQQVIVSTPLGFREQKDFEKDAWGLKGVKWQQHFSGWIPENFSAEGWQVLICEEYSYMDVGRVYDKPLGVMWAIWNNPAASPAGRYATLWLKDRIIEAKPDFITRLQLTDNIVIIWACLLRRLPPKLSKMALGASLQISIKADQLLRGRRLR